MKETASLLVWLRTRIAVACCLLVVVVHALMVFGSRKKDTSGGELDGTPGREVSSQASVASERLPAVWKTNASK